MYLTSMKSQFYLFLTIITVNCIVQDTVLSPVSPWQGSGTKSNPWRISDPNDLEAMTVNSSYYSDYFILTSDVDLKGKIYYRPLIAPKKKPVLGMLKLKHKPFAGNFDGKDHTISNLIIHSDYDRIGLFGKVSPKANIKNLSVKNISIMRMNEPLFYKDLPCTGGLVGLNEGTISNCNITVSIVGKYFDCRIGGLVGWNEGNIKNCHSNCSIKGCDSHVGCLVGVNENGYINACYAKGIITGEKHSSALGGLVGNTGGGHISNCYALTTVSAGDESHWLGGLVGFNEQGKISYSYAKGYVSGDFNVGGLVGLNVGQISNSYASGLVKGNGALGGLVGTNGSNATSYRPVIPCFIRNSYAAGSVVGDKKAVNLGGLVGGIEKGEIANCYSTGSVSAGEGSWKIGGLVGQNYEGVINNSYAVSSVKGGEGAYFIGGFIGRNFNNISNCFWDKEKSGIDLGIGKERGGVVENLQGKTTAQMQMQSTFARPPTNWDFIDESTNGTEDIWCMPLKIRGYPILNWQPKAEKKPENVIR